MNHIVNSATKVTLSTPNVTSHTNNLSRRSFAEQKLSVH